MKPAFDRRVWASLGSCWAMLAVPTWATAQGLVEVRLGAILDEPRAYCIDMMGYKERARTDRPLQAHTCYSYQGAIAVDQGVERQLIGSGRFRFPHFEVCMSVEPARAGGSLRLEECADAREQRFRFTAAGEIRPEAAPDLCVTVGPEPGVAGGGGQPVHLRRGLLLDACAAAAAPRQRWQLR